MMDTIKKLSVLLFLYLSPIIPHYLMAQTYTTLHGFTGSDGLGPTGSLIMSGGNLYGTTSDGGSHDKGTVFALKTDGSSLTNLHFFTGADGANPFTGVVLSGSTLYGTTRYGGGFSTGTIFKVNTDGTSFITLHHFSGNDGAQPMGVVLSGDTLYGTSGLGGPLGYGTVYSVNTDGTAFTNFHSFALSDGAQPSGELILSGNMVYGLCGKGGPSRAGTVFGVSTDGTGFTNLHSFSFNSADGSSPVGSLIISGNTLYGTTFEGGSGASFGTLFKVNTDGTGFKTLHSFTSVPDGAHPIDGLVLRGSTLYGSTSSGGSSFGLYNGLVFAVETDGTGWTTLHSFIGGSDGAMPQGKLLLSGNTLYGATAAGTIFGISLAVQLTIIPYGGDVLLGWPTRPSGYTLQSTTNLLSPIWTKVSAGTVVLDGQNIVIEPSSGTQQFYRLNP